jgi:hypothetical protein
MSPDEMEDKIKTLTYELEHVSRRLRESEESVKLLTEYNIERLKRISVLEGALALTEQRAALYEAIANRVNEFLTKGVISNGSGN